MTSTSAFGLTVVHGTFNKTMSGTGTGCVVAYISLAPIAYASSRQSFYSDYYDYAQLGGRMYSQLAVGRGSTTSTLRVCCQRADQTGASVVNLNTKVSANFTKSEDWHYIWVQTRHRKLCKVHSDDAASIATGALTLASGTTQKNGMEATVQLGASMLEEAQ